MFMIIQASVFKNFTHRMAIYFYEATRRLLKYLNVRCFPVIIKKHKIYVRTFNQVDITVINYVFKDLNHRPFLKLRNNGPVILDLGSNIGCTILDFKKEYPTSRVIGCEMDWDNYNLAVKNCSRCTNVEIINNALWYEDGTVNYYKGNNSYSNPDSYSITRNVVTSNSKSVSLVSVGSVSVNSLVKIFSIEKIDYVKMDIEGAELEVIQNNNEWLRLVKQIKIEYHRGEKDAEKINEILISNGFTSFKADDHPSTIIAFRD